MRSFLIYNLVTGSVDKKVQKTKIKKASIGVLTLFSRLNNLTKLLNGKDFNSIEM